MATVGYIASSSFSGSTLLTFLLNVHPSVTTVGELEGWSFNPAEKFYCSCGREIRQCDLFRFIEKAFRQKGLPFAYHDFGTRFRPSRHDWFNDHFFSYGLPWLKNNRLESLTERLLLRLPRTRSALLRQAEVNRCFIEKALEYHKASIFIDSSKSPYRLRHLSGLTGISVRGIHLIRDPRAIAASHKRKKGTSVMESIRRWQEDQERIARVLQDVAPVTLCFYEDLCIDVLGTLNRIYGHLKIEPISEVPAYRSVEHHVLGNTMRFSSSDDIVLDERWKKDLSRQEAAIVHQELDAYLRKHDGGVLSEMLSRYLA